MAHFKNRIGMIGALRERLPKSLEHNPGAVRMFEIATKIHDGAKSLAAMYEAQNPDHTRSYHEKKVAESSNKLAQQNKAAFAKLNMELGNAMTYVQHKITDKVKLVPNDKYAAEARAIYRSLPTMAEKLRFLNQLCVDNNGPELAAIVDAPNSLTGISKEDQNRFRNHILSIHAADEMAEQKTIMETFDLINVMLKGAGEVTDQLSSPARMEEISREQSAAEEAEARFNASLVEG